MSALVAPELGLFSDSDCAEHLGCSIRQVCTDGEVPGNITVVTCSYRHTPAAVEAQVAYRTLPPARPSTSESLADAVARVVAASPRLSEAQLERLAIIIDGGGAA